VRWRSLEGIAHALALEDVVIGPLGQEVLDLDFMGAYADSVPRVPAASALAAATRGLELFRDLTDTERRETKDALVWLLLSPTARDGADNSVYDETRTFAAGELNPSTGFACPHRMRLQSWWPRAVPSITRPRLRRSNPSSTHSRDSSVPQHLTAADRIERRAAARTRRWTCSP